MDERERFLEVATEPFADNAELELAARRELEAMIRDRKGEFETAIRRFEVADKRGSRLRGQGLLFVVAAVVVTACLLPTVRQLTDIVGHFSEQRIPMLGSLLVPTANPDAAWAQGLSDKARLLLFGDPGATGRAAKAKPLWRSDPLNPAYFSEYAAGYLVERSSLPPDFFEITDRIDPDNGWFPALAARAEGRPVKKERLSFKDRKAGKLAEWTVTDPAAFERSLELLRMAAARPRFDSYHITLEAKRARLLPPRVDMYDQIVSVAYLSSQYNPRFRLRDLSFVVAARCSQAAGPADVEWLMTLVADWERLLVAQLEDEEGSMLDGLLMRVQTADTAPFVAAALEVVGEAEEARRWKMIGEATDLRDSRDAEADEERRSRLDNRSTVFGATLASLQGVTPRSPEIRDQDLMVLANLEHAAFGRLMAAFGAILFLLIAGIISLQRLRDGLLFRRLAGRMRNLLTTSDRLLALASSAVVAIGYVAMIRFTPLGARDWSIGASSGVVPLGQFAAMLALMILMPLAVLRSRLASRANGTGLPFEAGRAIWVPVVAAALIFPLLAVPLPVGDVVPGRWLVAACCGALVIAWIAGMLFSGICGVRRARLRRGIMARESTGMLLAGAMLLALLVPLFHLEERRWMARETLFERTPEHPAIGNYEAQVARLLRNELRGLLDR